MKRLPTHVIDPFLLMLIGTVGLAVLLPARGTTLVVVSHLVYVAIALLFFLYGLRVAPALIVQGLAHWRLQGLVLVSTFVLFPLAALAIGAISRPFLPPPLVLGIVFLSVLPSTAQSSIAFTSVARGNVSAALCAASVSNLLGIVVTPILVAIVLGTRGAVLGFGAFRDIALQLLLPFVLGQATRPLLADWIGGRHRFTALVDRASVLIVVYAAFSEGMATGVWSLVSPLGFVLLVAVDCLLLAIILVATTVLSRRLGFPKEDEIAIVFCGSKKSLAAGIPMANILFAGQAVSLLLLPIMLFHQIQLFTCAILARRYASRAAAVLRPALAETAAGRVPS